MFTFSVILVAMQFFAQSLIDKFLMGLEFDSQVRLDISFSLWKKIAIGFIAHPTELYTSAFQHFTLVMDIL